MSNRLHYLNRVAMGERRFVWDAADMLARLGRVFAECHRDPEAGARFGDGWEAGSLPRDQHLPRSLR